MDDEIIISAKDLTKAYRIWKNPSARLKGPLYQRLARVLKPIRANKQLEEKASKYFDDFYALNGINFEVRKGESVGILGKNGAGKSTLLQILTGTLRPTSGELHIKGRIAALLELGSGFDPEFSGRDNVFLNASILGLTREQTENKFDDIVAFADIGSFLDQPVKTYSTGMMMRLAFAIACHVDCDILIVDEALSVGDSLFQMKCLNRISKMLDSGVTLLLTSHEVSTVKEHCRKSLLLNRGKQVLFGDSETVTDRYIKLLYGSSEESKEVIAGGSDALGPTDGTAAGREHGPAPADGSPSSGPAIKGAKWHYGHDDFKKRASIERSGNKKIEIINVQILDLSGQIRDSFAYGEAVIIRQHIRANHDSLGPANTGLKIRTKNGSNVVFLASYLTGCELVDLKKGSIYCLEWRLNLNLQHGNYNLWVAVSDVPHGENLEVFDCVPYAAIFTVAERKPWMIDGFCAWEIKPTLSLED